MAITTVTPASTRLLASLTSLQGDITIDNLILAEDLITQASASIERLCGYTFAQQVYTETFERQREPKLILRQRPIVAVATVLVGQTAETDYRIIDAEVGILYRRKGWWAWDSDDPYITVTYTAGYVLPDQTNAPVANGPKLPADLVRATLEMVKVWHHELLPAERVTGKTFGLTGDRVDFGVSAMRGAIPPLAKSLLHPYMRAVVA